MGYAIHEIMEVTICKYVKRLTPSGISDFDKFSWSEIYLIWIDAAFYSLASLLGSGWRRLLSTLFSLTELICIY